MSKTKLIYIAGKMSGKLDWGQSEFAAAETELIKQGFQVVNPFNLHEPPTKSYEDEVAAGGWDAKWATYLKKDIPVLLTCDELRVTGPDWVDSRGARLEVAVATALFLPVKTLAGDPITSGKHIKLEMPKPAPEDDILVEAYKLTTGDRNISYGDPTVDFQRTAAMWSAMLGIELAAKHVALCMAALKISRACWSDKRDHYVDLSGYARCGWLCVQKEKESQ